MSIPIRYQIEVAGADQMRRILRSIEKEAQASAKRGATATRAADREVIRSKNQLERDAARAEAGKLRNLERFERQKIRIQNASFAMEQRMRDKSERSAIASAKRKERVEIMSAKRAQRAREATASTIAGGAARTAGGATRGLAMVGGSILALGGGFAAGSAIGEDMRIRAHASRLANQAGRPELKNVLADHSRRVKGFTGEETLAGMESFVDVTGDLDAAAALIQDMGKVALATGTDLADLGAAMGNTFAPIADQVKDPAERLEKMRDVMRAVAGMGAVGAVEIKDLASEMASLAAASTSFEGDAAQNVKLMTAMAQAARFRGGGESAATAVTAVRMFASDISSGVGLKRAKAMGVNPFADKGQTALKDPREIIADILEATGGDLEKIGSIFGERSMRAAKGVLPNFVAAEKQRKGSGRAAVMAEYDRLLNASVSPEAVEQRVASRLADPDLQFKETVKEFNHAMSRELMPVITKAMPELAEAIPTLARGASAAADFAKFFIENPLHGIGAIVLAKVGAEITSAGIGVGVEKAITSVISRSFTGGKLVKDATGAETMVGQQFGGKFAASLTGATIGITGAVAIYASGVSVFESGEADVARAGAALERIREGVASGTMSEAEVRRIRKEEIEAPLTGMKKTGMLESALQPVGSLMKFAAGPLSLANALLPEGFADRFASDFSEITGQKADRSHVASLEDFDKQARAEQNKAQMQAAEGLKQAAADLKAAAAANGAPARNNPIVKRN